MIIKTTGFMCAMLLASMNNQPVKTTEWVLAKQKDGITAYVGKSIDNGVASTKTEMTINVSPETVVKAISDYNNYKEWIPYCKTSYTVQKISDTVVYAYQRISAPLVTDRDAVVRCTVLKKGTHDYEILITGVPNYIKTESRAIRIQYLISHYYINVDKYGATHIIQVNGVDIGGNIPTFLLNWANRIQPFETFQNLRKFILNKQTK